MTTALSGSSDDPIVLGAVTITHAAPAPAGIEPRSRRWTWPVNRHLHQLVSSSVAEAYRAWGRPGLADLLGELAVELASSVGGSYVAVTAGIEEGRATLSAVTATSPRTPETDVATRARHGQQPTAWGLHGEVGTVGAYAGIRFARRIP
jgi:hypothetical protein